MPPRAPDVDQDGPADAVRAKSGRRSFTLKEIGQHNTPEDCWLIIRGKVYDVTTWVPKHPGGPVIYCKAGGECTQLFESYHPLKVRKTLDKYEVGDVKLLPGEEGMLTTYEDDTGKAQFYGTVKERVETFFHENKINPRVSYEMYVKSACIFALLASSYYVTFWCHPPFLVSALFAALWGFAMAEVGVSIQHDANHGAYGKSTLFAYVMGCSLDLVGASSFMWKQQHVVGHHAYTNVDGLDPDIRVKDPDIRRVSDVQPKQSYHVYQHFYLAAAYGLLALKSVVADDFLALSSGRIGSVTLAKMTPDEKAVFWGGKALFFTYSILAPTLFSGHSLAYVLGMWTWGLAITGWCLACMFQVAHVISECSWPAKDPKTGKVAEGWAAAQMKTSADFAHGSFFWTHVSGGLNYQVVHHLFPGICHCHYPKIAPIVTKTANEFGLEHIVFPTFWEALCAHFAHLKRMGVAEVRGISMHTVG